MVQRHAMLVGSSGGHLAQLMALEPWWSSWRRTWVTFDTPDAVSLLRGERTVWAHHPTTRNVVNALRNARLAIRVLRTERPDIVVSTGAGVAVPFFLVARALGIPTVFIEVYDRIDTATLTGRLCRPFASMVCVQWDEQLRLYPRARVIGGLL
jgi:nitroreductase